MEYLIIINYLYIKSHLKKYYYFFIYHFIFNKKLHVSESIQYIYIFFFYRTCNE